VFAMRKSRGHMSGSAEATAGSQDAPGRTGSVVSRPTMRDVATRAGVSTALVSVVFRGVPGASAQTRARVLEAASQLGYRHNRTASRLALRRTRLLGVTMVLRSPFQAELVEELQIAAAEHDYDIAISAVTPIHNERHAVDRLMELRTEALILLGTEIPTSTLTTLGQQLPVVVVGRRVQSPTVDVVRTADFAGVGFAVDHLVGLGHRRIGHVDGGTGVIPSDRRRGYRAAMRRCGLANYVYVIPGDYTEQAGARAAATLLTADPRPTGVIAFNDQCAVGLLDGLAQEGVDVPGSISVVGYDDNIISRLAYVGLTTVSQELQQQARHAVRAALERLDGGRTTPVNKVLPPRLVVRSTTGPSPTASTAKAIPRAPEPGRSC
jgi:DNA-binding LacI/PurR family transcriptional regulator